MNTYKYSALSPDGAKVNGVVDAVDEYAAVRRIKTDCPVVLSISEVKEQAGVVKFLNADIGGKKVDLKSLSVMCSQFHIIMGSGVPVDAAIRMIAQQTVDKNLRRMLEKSADDVSQGTPMSVAFSKNYPQLPTLFIETVRAGEISGTIDRSFGTLEKYYEKTYKLQQKVKAALSYPLFVLGVAIVVLIVVMGSVMPTFTSIFKDLGADLPMITVVLISITNFFQKWWALILAVIALAIILLEVWKHSDQGRLQWAKFVLRAPVFGNINNLQACTEFATTMATLLEAGMGVDDSLDVTSKCMSSAYHQDQVHSMVEQVQTGAPLGQIMKNNGYFPQVLNEMTAVGEETGELAKTLSVIGDYYTNEYNFATNKAVSKLEPALLIVLALFAGFIVIALYLPMFTMYNAM